MREIDFYESNKSYLQEVGKIKRLTEEETKDLIIKIKNGDKSAVKKLVYHNLALVIFAAKKYINPKIPFEDLIQEGSLGLIKAAESYDIEQQTSFSTYAIKCIKNKIIDYIYDNKNMVKAPENLQALKVKYDNFVSYYQMLTGQTPKANFVLEQLGVSANKIKEMKKYIKNEVSLDESLSIDNDFTLLDTLADDKSSNEIFEYVEKEDISIKLKKAIESLNEQEKQIIILRYGFNGNKPMTLLEIGKIYHCSVETVRKNEMKALKKLRKIEIKKGLTR